MLLLGLPCVLILLIYKINNPQTSSSKVYSAFKGFLHQIIEGNFLYMITSAVYCMRVLDVDDGERWISVLSLIFSYGFVIGYTLYLLYVYRSIINHFSKKDQSKWYTKPSIKSLKYDDETKEFISQHPFYLGTLILDTKYNALYTVACQFKKLVCSIIIIAGIGNVLL